LGTPEAGEGSMTPRLTDAAAARQYWAGGCNPAWLQASERRFRGLTFGQERLPVSCLIAAAVTTEVFILAIQQTLQDLAYLNFDPWHAAVRCASDPGVCRRDNDGWCDSCGELCREDL
jgi:hypothetical protein